MSDYFTLRLSGLSPQQAELLSGELFEFGATGIQENLPFKQDGEFYEPTLLDSDTTCLLAYFPAEPDQKLLTWISLRYPKVQLEVSCEENKDWLAEWKKGFDSFELIDGIYVVPSWKEPPESAKAFMRIDPGMAFGTGTHETTQLASAVLGRLQLKGQSVLDVGTGTGILALLAEKLGATHVVGLEIDEEARRTARENIVNNQSQVKIRDESLEQVKEKFGVVVANIIDGVLIRLQEDLRRALAPHGHLILTGILEERDASFRERFSFAGFDLIERAQNGEWVGYLLRARC